MIELQESIEKKLTWFRDNCHDCELPILMICRDRLSVESYELAKIVGEAQTEYNGAYFIRRLSVNKTTNRLVKEGMAVNKSEALSIEENEDHFKHEMEKESEAFCNSLLLKQVNQVLSAMQQRISTQRKELEQ